MSEVMYRVGFQMSKHEVAKVTAKTVVMVTKNGRKSRESIKSRYVSWFHTFEEAKTFMIETKEKDIARRERYIATQAKKLAVIHSMVEEDVSQRAYM